MKKIRLFLASSLELAAERQAIERFVREKNDFWAETAQYLELISSDDFQKALSNTGSQSEYNTAIRGVEIFVLLFSTKVGEYTRMEFEAAYAEHQATGGSPRIFVFWNVEKVSLKTIDRAGINSLFEFQQRLNDGGHYWIEYSNTDALIRTFNDQLDRYFSPIPNTSGAGSPAPSLAELTRLTLSIDDLLLDAVRDMQNLGPGRRAEVYEKLFQGALAGQKITAREFFPGYVMEQARRLAETARKQVDLTIEVSSGLEKLRYVTRDFEVEVDHPVLMWNCHCGVLASLRPEQRAACASPAAECPIHRDPNGDRLTEIYRTGLILTTYDGHSVIWRRSPEVWPPTIDSFVMCRNMWEDGVFSRDHRTVLDLGCGTGFLGLYLGYRNSSVQEIRLADWLLTPLIYAMMSRELDPTRRPDLAIVPLLGLNTSWMMGKVSPMQVDMCVCNPPYLPSFDKFPEIGLHHTVGGTELLVHLIEKSASIAKETYINFSDMALPEANAAAARYGRRLREVGKPLTVPFTVPQAFRYPGYIDRLASEARILPRDQTGYRWWHNIRTYTVETH